MRVLARSKRSIDSTGKTLRQVNRVSALLSICRRTEGRSTWAAAISKQKLFLRYDSDNPRVHGDVGMAGVAIDSIEDMEVRPIEGSGFTSKRRLYSVESSKENVCFQ